MTGRNPAISINVVDIFARRGYRFNGTARLLPAADPDLLGSAPTPGSPDYAVQALAFINLYVADDWNGLPVNFQSTFLMSREGARYMQRRRYGRIVNLSSVAVPLQLEGEAVYAASKAAIATFSEILAREVAAFNITVNAFIPAILERTLMARKTCIALWPEAVGRISDTAKLSSFSSCIVVKTSTIKSG